MNSNTEPVWLAKMAQGNYGDGQHQLQQAGFQGSLRLLIACLQQKGFAPSHGVR